MKTIYKLFVGSLLFCVTTQVNAQFLVSYEFENPPGTNPSTAPTSVSAGITVTNMIGTGVTNVAATNPGNVGGNSSPTGYALQAGGWPTGNALDPSKYLEFTITANPGCTFAVTELQIGGQRVDDSSDPGFFEIRSSYDMFATSLNRGALGPVTTIDGTFTSSIYTAMGNTTPPSPFTATGQTSLTFRGYYYGTASLTRTDMVRAIGQVTCPVGMPVEFASFEGKAAGNRVQLSWATSLERNADHFEVQRSQNAAEFVGIGQVKAAGDATQKQAYGFTDEQALTGVNYYRLRQVDRDGSVQFSKIIAVTTRPEAAAIAVLGNPTEGSRIRLQLFNLNASQLRLTDMQGRSMAFRITESAGGVVTLEPTGILSSGIYLVGAAKVPAIKVVVR